MCGRVSLWNHLIARSMTKRSKSFHICGQRNFLEENSHFGGNTVKCYTDEYITLGGAHEDINSYTIQSLMLKVTDRFDELIISKQANKSGNFVFPPTLTRDEATAIINESDNRSEKMRSAAMTLRSEILALPQSTTPSPTSVHTLKENAPDLPELVILFFRTLIGGLQLEHENQQSVSLQLHQGFSSSMETPSNWFRTGNIDRVKIIAEYPESVWPLHQLRRSEAT